MTSSTIDTDVRKALSEIAAALTCKGMLVFYFWALFAFWATSGILRENICVLFGVALSFVLIISFVLYLFLIDPFP